MRIERGLRLGGLIALGLLPGACGRWTAAREEPPATALALPAGAAAPRPGEPATPVPLVSLPAAAPGQPPTQSLERMPEDASPVLEMHRNPDGEGYLVTLRPESGLPILKPGARMEEFERAANSLGAVIIQRSERLIEVAPGGAHEGLELPLRVFYEFDDAGRFVRTTGDF